MLPAGTGLLVSFLKFGREARTSTMQAGLTELTFREIFSSAMHNLMLRNVMGVFWGSLLLVKMEDWMTEAPIWLLRALDRPI